MLTGAGPGVVSEQELQQVRQRLGLDRPLPVQLAEWAWNVAMFDFGTSLRTGNAVMADISRRLPFTLQIVVMAILISVCLGVPAGVTAARYQGPGSTEPCRQSPRSGSPRPRSGSGCSSFSDW